MHQGEKCTEEKRKQEQQITNSYYINIALTIVQLDTVDVIIKGGMESIQRNNYPAIARSIQVQKKSGLL